MVHSRRSPEVELPILQYLRRVRQANPSPAPVPLQNLVNPGDLIVQLKESLDVSKLEALHKDELDALSVRNPKERELILRLSTLADVNEVSAQDALLRFRTNVSWQYFCDLNQFVWRFPATPGIFEQFYAKKPGPINLDHFVQFPIPAKSTIEPAPVSATLAQLVDPMDPRVLANELIPWRQVNKLIEGKTANDLFVRMALLAEENRGSAKWALQELHSNPYWQFFCGFEYFTNRIDTKLENLDRFFRKFRASDTFRAILRITDPAFEAAQKLSLTNDPFALAVNELLIPKILNLDKKIFPLEAKLLVHEATPEFWRDLIDAFRKWGWKTTFTDNIIENQSADLAVIGGIDNSGRLIFFSRGPTEPYERLDASLRGLVSLWNLLKHDRAKDAYFEALQGYFGEYRFPRQAYDAILSQLETLLLKVPGLEDRLWNRASCGKEFSLTPKIPSYGRELNPREFQSFLEGYFSRLLHPAYAGRRPEEFTSMLNEISRRVELFELSNQQGKAQLRRARASSFYQQIRSNREIGEIASMCLHHFLHGDEAKTVFQSQNPDVIIEFFRELRQNPGRVLRHAGFLEIPFWASVIRENIPSTQVLLSRHDVFPVTTIKTRSGKTVARGRTQAVAYRFRPPTRLLHGIWRGVMWKECMGGDLEHLDQLMPERWANMVIRSTKFYFVEQNGKFLGTIQLTPIRINRKRFWSLDSDWPHFFNRIGMPGKRKPEFVTLFEAWLRKQQDIVVGNSTLVHRFPHELETLRALPCYRRGKQIGKPTDVAFDDPIAGEIMKASHNLGFGTEYRNLYGSSILIDATVADASPLVLLRTRS